MNTADKRPINIDVFRYRYPITAIVSVLHRLSGVAIFLLLPFALWMLEQSLASAEQFQQLKIYFTHSWFTFVVWLTLAAVLYHLVAGVRHLLMDMGYGESKRGGQIGSYIVLIIAALLIALAGVWLW